MWHMSHMVIGIGLSIHRTIRFMFTKPWPIWPASNMNVKGPNSRRLGYMEKIYAKMGSSGVYNNSFVLILQSNKQLTATSICKPLLDLSQRHPLLRMRLGKEGEWFTYMAEMDDFKLDFKVCMSADWKSEAEMLARQIFDAENGPLWRVSFLPNATKSGQCWDGVGFQSVCVFTFHHTITDGISCCHLFKEFIKMVGGSYVKNKLTLESMSLLPPMEHYVKSDSFKKTLKWNINVLLSWVTVLLYSVVEKSLFCNLFRKKIPTKIPQSSESGKMLNFEMNENQTSQLLFACKKHGVTVQAAFQAALSVASVLISSDKDRIRNFCALLPVNMRPYLKSDFPQDYLGFYIVMVTTNTDISANLPFWQVAKTIKQSLHEKLQVEEQISKMAHLPSVWKALVSEVQLSNSDTVDIFLSNLGNLNFLDNDDSCEVNLEALYITGTLSGFEQEFANFIATINGKLFWSLVYHGSSTSERRAKMFMDLVMQTLLPAIKE